MIYGALASQVYGSVADQVYHDMATHNPSVEETEASTGPDPTSLFEAARAKFFQEGQKVVSHLINTCRIFNIYIYLAFYPLFLFTEIFC